MTSAPPDRPVGGGGRVLPPPPAPTPPAEIDRSSRFNFWGGVLGNLITAVASVVATLILTGDAAPVDCVDRRTAVAELVEEQPVWVPLPDNSDDQSECAINEYVDELLPPEPAPTQ